MRLFKGKALLRQPADQGDKLNDKVAGVIAGGIISFQVKVSALMNKMKGLKIVLIIFCFTSGSLSIYFLVNALVTQPKPAFKIDKVLMPKHFDKSGDEIMEVTVPDDMYRHIQEYKQYMDSLGEAIRPGLLDSIRILEQIYLSQQK